MKSKRLSQSDVDALLAQPLVGKVATHGRNGDMRVTPVWFKRDGSGLLMNTLEQTDLAHNLARDPRCSVLVDTTDVPNVMAVHYWRTAQVQPDADVAGIASIIERYVGGPEQGSVFAQRNLSIGPVVYVRFTPQREVSWDLRPSEATAAKEQTCQVRSTES